MFTIVPGLYEAVMVHPWLQLQTRPGRLCHASSAYAYLAANLEANL